MRNKTLWIVSLLLAASLIGCGGSGAPDADWTLQVGGEVGTPLAVSYQELVEMPQTELSDILMERSEGEDTTGSWSGPPSIPSTHRHRAWICRMHDEVEASSAPHKARHCFVSERTSVRPLP